LVILSVARVRPADIPASLTGIGEVVLLPLDVLKIKMQTNPDAVRGRSFFRLITDEGIGSLYRGWGWTMARNAPGSFAVSRRGVRCETQVARREARGMRP
jgi:hypothetical protein